MLNYITALSIAGSDSSGGAGIQADIKTMSALGVYAMTAITAVTVQNTCGVTDVGRVAPEIVAGQIDVVFADIPPKAVKIGMLFDAVTATTVADALLRNHAVNIVLDPVMVSTSGSRLLAEDAVKVIVERLIPLADIITPNAMEAKALTDSIDPAAQIARLKAMGAKRILIKGGDTDVDADTVTDYFADIDGSVTPIVAKRVASNNTHGTGCTLSSAIAAYLACGRDMRSAVLNAREYMSRAIAAGAEVAIGHGHGPVNHFFAPEPLRAI
jgi:hydroxymethylpyrimidine/phosphomethylpyrimidine kinase